MDEQPLAGGFVNEVARVGSTVRRPMGGRAQFVHELLGMLEEQGWTGAPRFLGVDEQGREILSFIDGHVAWERALRGEVASEPALVRVAEMVRELHDLTASTRLADSNLHLGPEVTNVTQAAGRLRLICDAYRLTDRARLLDTILWWQDRCWRGIEAGAVAGEPAMVHLRDSGAGAEVRAAFAWTQTHRAELETELR